MDEIELITVSKADYDLLIRDQKVLQAMRAAGVDNWNGYDGVLESLEEMNED